MGGDAPREASDDLPVPAVPTVDFALGFTVSAGPGYRVVRARPGTDALEGGRDRAWADHAHVMVLVDRGATPSLPAELRSAPRFEVPARRVTANRDADALRVKVLGHLDQLRGIGGTQIYDAEIVRRVASGEIGSVGSALHRTTNVEFLLTEAIDAAFFRIASLEHASQFSRLLEVGVPAIPVFTWAERSYLGRAEWIKFVALFLGADQEAERIFDGIRARRDSLVDLVADAEPVAVVWAYRSGDRWLVHRNSLESQLVEDAGGRNVLHDVRSGVTANEGGFSEGVPMTDEEFLVAAADARYWITWDHTDAQWPSGRYLDEIPAYREGRVFHHRARVRPEQGGDDWYEGAQVDPTTVLADLVALLHPDRAPDHDFAWLEPLERTR